MSAPAQSDWQPLGQFKIKLESSFVRPHPSKRNAMSDLVEESIGVKDAQREQCSQSEGDAREIHIHPARGERALGTVATIEHFAELRWYIVNARIVLLRRQVRD